MSRFPVMGAGLTAWLVTALGVGAAAQPGWADDAAGVRVVIESPEMGEVVRGVFDMAPVAGVAMAGERPSDFDLVFALDVSGSTEHCSLVDLDRDGELGRREPALVPGLPEVACSDPEDSILSAEVRAALALLEDLDPKRIRVGVVTFSGVEDPTGASQDPQSVADASLEQSLTHDFEAVRRALEAVLERGSRGGTNIAHGLRLSVWQLTGGRGAAAAPRDGAKKVILLLTDGTPSLPHPPGNHQDPEDILAAQSAARMAAQSGIQVNLYGIGPGAVEEPIAATQIARTTGGIYHAVGRPGDIVSVFSGVTFANVNSVVAVNLTSGEAAGPHDIHLRPDGSFSGFVPVVPGKNRLRIAAFSTDGVRGTAELTIDYRHQEMTTAEKRAELERIRQRTRAIQLEAERRRQETLRTAEQERAVDIEIENPSSEENQP